MSEQTEPTNHYAMGPGVTYDAVKLATEGFSSREMFGPYALIFEASTTNEFNHLMVILNSMTEAGWEPKMMTISPSGAMYCLLKAPPPEPDEAGWDMTMA